MPATVALTANSLAALIRAHRFRYGNEDELQAGISLALVQAGLQVQREFRLDSRSRIDLLVGDPSIRAIGVEVKVAGDPGSVLRQVRRYCASPLMHGLVLVTTRVGHHLPWTIDGKPIVVVQLAGRSL